MKRNGYAKRIEKAVKSLGIYRDEFEGAVRTMSELMERRDKLLEQYVEDGEQPLVEFTNKGGATNLVKNPILAVLDDTEQLILSYRRELGLTPAAYRKISDEGMRKESGSVLGEALKMLG